MGTNTTGASVDDSADMAAIIPGSEGGQGEGGVYGKTGFAWAWFEWARNPYYILVVIYIFAPYFAGLIAADVMASGELADLGDAEAGAAARAQGQATIATVTKWAGVVAGLTAPFLGAAFDRGLKRKPFIAVFLSVIAVMSWLLWFAMPGSEGGLSNLTIMFVLVAAYVTYTYSEVLHNSMLPDAARNDALPGVSGLGLSLGNASSTVLFIALVLLLFLPAEAGWPYDTPRFGLDPAMAEHVRIVGPLCAVWLAVMILPFFLYAKDTGTWGTPIFASFRNGAAGVINTIKRAPEHREAFKFLIARTIYADGMAALLALSAVYVSLFLGWGFTELIASAIWGSVFAVIGGYVGGRLDGAFGPKNALIIELIGIVCILFVGLSITNESLFFGLVDNREVWDSPFFPTLSDLVYLFNGAFIAIFATANISSSRTMLIHVAPVHMRGEFFGLYAIAGSITIWIGPLLVEQFTKWSGDQRIGMSAIALLFFIGLAVLTTVKSEKTPASA